MREINPLAFRPLPEPCGNLKGVELDWVYVRDRGWEFVGRWWSEVEPPRTKSGRIAHREQYGECAYILPYGLFPYGYPDTKPHYPIATKDGYISARGLLRATVRGKASGTAHFTSYLRGVKHKWGEKYLLQRAGIDYLVAAKAIVLARSMGAGWAMGYRIPAPPYSEFVKLLRTPIEEFIWVIDYPDYWREVKDEEEGRGVEGIYYVGVFDEY